MQKAVKSNSNIGIYSALDIIFIQLPETNCTILIEAGYLLKKAA